MTDAERYERGRQIIHEVNESMKDRTMDERVQELMRRIEAEVLQEGGEVLPEEHHGVEIDRRYQPYVVEPQPERVPEEPVVTVPPRAFPDDFYYKPEIRVEPAINMPQLWVTPTENFGKKSYADWNHSSRITHDSSLLCMCGHPFEEHMPACCHLVEGCGCEGFLKMPQGSVEGG